jgi:hypothetical protein
MRHTTKLVIVQRITHYPPMALIAMAEATGLPIAPQSMWVAVGVNTAEVVAQAPEKDKILELLNQKGNYKVTRILNDWN